MEIVERVAVINSHAVLIGDQDIKLTLEIETGRVTIDTPAMFTDPKVSLTSLREKLNNLAEYQERESHG